MSKKLMSQFLCRAKIVQAAALLSQLMAVVMVLVQFFANTFIITLEKMSVCGGVEIAQVP